MMKCRLLALSERHALLFLSLSLYSSLSPSSGLSLHPFFFLSSFFPPLLACAPPVFSSSTSASSGRRPLHLLSFSAPPTFVLLRTLYHFSAISFACPPLLLSFFPFSFFCRVTLSIHSIPPSSGSSTCAAHFAVSICPRSPRKRFTPVAWSP